MKKSSSIVLLILAMLVVVKCKKKEEKDAEPSSSTPTVSTSSISSITKNTAVSGGNVSSEGSESVTARGICWSTSPTPTISNDTTLNGSGPNSFTAGMTELSANTTYYVRAYAINSVGTSYGNQISFKTACEDGYEGPSCVAVNQKFAGTYSLSESCNTSGTGSYSVTVSANNNVQEITFAGLWEVPASQVIGQIGNDGTSFTIARQQILSGFDIVSTNGSYNAQTSTITLSYTIYPTGSNSQADGCTATLVKN